MYDEIRYWDVRENPNAAGEEVPHSDWTDYIFNNIMGCQTLLDFGPGIGRFFPLYTAFDCVHCFDITQRHLPELTRKANELGFLVLFEKGTEVGVTPFWDHQFDVVICVQVLLHQSAKNIEKVMQELARIGKKVVVISFRSEQPIHLAPHVFNHDYLSICDHNDWTVRQLIQTKEHIFFTYWRE